MRETFRAGDPVASWALLLALWLVARQSDGATLVKAPSRASVDLRQVLACSAPGEHRPHWRAGEGAEGMLKGAEGMLKGAVLGSSPDFAACQHHELEQVT